MLYALENKKGICFSSFEIMFIQKHRTVPDLFRLRVRSHWLASWTLRMFLYSLGPSVFFSSLRILSALFVGAPSDSAIFFSDIECLRAAECWKLYLLSVFDLSSFLTTSPPWVSHALGPYLLSDTIVTF